MDTDTMVLIVAGVLTGGMGAAATFNQAFATNYALKSPKAALWRQMLGEERAVVAVRRVFGPIALLLGAAMIAWSIFPLLKR